MKYIIIDFVFPVLFTDAIEHKKMANGRFVTSAGFVKIVDGKVEVYGDSISLKLKPDVDDADIISLMLERKE